jgi:sialic acid synthase SpsE
VARASTFFTSRPHPLGIECTDHVTVDEYGMVCFFSPFEETAFVFLEALDMLAYKITRFKKTTCR